MIVALPYCAKDYGLALKNLQWCIKLGGTTPYKAVLIRESGFKDDALTTLARQFFTGGVEEFVYDDYRGDPTWPHPQNYTFRRFARWMSLNSKDKDSYFWWEADCTPLRKGWIHTIAEEYSRSGKPFMGHIVDGSGHMTGCGVYPHDAPAYSVNMMRALDVPFDVAASTDMGISEFVHKANDLIQHVWNVNGAPATFRKQSDIKGLIPNSAVVFHRCKDGSLIDVLNSGKLAQIAERIMPEVPTIRVKETWNRHLTGIVTSHRRPEGLLRAVQSMKDVGFTKIVVAATGVNDSMKAAFKKLGKGVTVIQGDYDSHVSWTEGIRAAKTKNIYILHDDDYLIPGFANAARECGKHALVTFNARFNNHEGHIHDPLRLQAGTQNIRAIRNFQIHEGNSLSPCLGIFRRDQALAAMEAIEETKENLYYRSDFVVGNDLLLYLYVADKNKTFYHVPTPGVALGTEDSTTALEMESGYAYLKRFYKEARDIYLLHGKSQEKWAKLGKCCVLCYLPPRKKFQVDDYLENADKFKTEFPLIYYTDQVDDYADLKPRIIQEGASYINTGLARSDNLAAQYWMHGMNLAISEGYDYVIYTETDCRYSRPKWDLDIYQSFEEWPHLAINCGTPVVWHPWGRGDNGHAFSMRLIDYAYRYQQECGVNMAIEGQGCGVPFSMYPNGALALYDTDFVRYYFEELQDPANRYATVAPFDLILGRRMAIAYGDAILERLAWSKHTYSGCKNHHVDQATREKWLKDKRKSAIHHFK